MARHGKPNATGRSSGKDTGRRGAALKPPKGSSFAWLTREILASSAWRALSPNARRLMDFLMLEHCNHAGQANGNLKATHDQLRKYGLSANSIRPAIEEAAFLGLIRFQRGGRWGETNQPTIFRLTFYGGSDQSEATNDWRRRTEDQIKAWKQEQAQQRKGRAAKKQKAALTTASTVPSDQRVPSPLRVVGKT